MASTPANHRKKIVIVEDDIFVLAFITSVLRGAEYEVMAAPDGRSAMATFDQMKGEVDLLLTDFRLPDTDGYRLARDLLQKYPNLKVICMSALVHVQARFAELGLQFIEKPFAHTELIAKIREYLAK